MGAYGSPQLHPAFRDDGTNNSNSSNNSNDEDSFLDYIPGFRHRNPVHIGLASFYYISTFSSCFFGNSLPIYIRAMRFAGTLGLAYLISVFFRPPAHTKRMFYAFVAAVLIFIGHIGTVMKNDYSSSAAETTQTVAMRSTEGLIDYATFQKINAGMSYKSVVKLAGAEGTITASSGEGVYNTFIATWDGYGDLGANVAITFQNNKVVSKAQYGLK